MTSKNYLDKATKSVRKAGNMPAVFGTRPRTKLVAFLALHGTAPTTVIARALCLNQPCLMRSLRFAQAMGIIEPRGRGAVRPRCYHRINRAHPAYAEIVALGKALGRHYGVPAPEKFRLRLTSPEPLDQEFDPSNLFGRDASVCGRSEVLLFLGALEASIPISRLAGVLRKDRNTLLYRIKTLEASGLVSSTRRGREHLLRLNTGWFAHRELAVLLHKLNTISPPFVDLAAAYDAAGGAVAYIR